MAKTEFYNIGLDIGTASVGWCVTDKENNILKRNGRNMWGSRIFEEGTTAEATRLFRSSKRRLNRRKERINILQSLIIDDMEKEYPNFFPMLRETYLNIDDKNTSEKILGIKYNLFSNKDLTDKEYYRKYPTIYHLRSDLITNTQKVDLRLVYLAIHHIIKYRGNFLYEGDFAENTNEVANSLETISEYLKNEHDITLNNIGKTNILEILNNKNISKMNKKDKMILCFSFDTDKKQIIVNIINAILGYSFDLGKIFDIDMEAKISFASEIKDEEKIMEELKENDEVYNSMNAIYSWHILQNILNNKQFISDAFINKYENYGRDLKLLKSLYKKYFTTVEYEEMFRKVGKDNYVAYNGKNKGETCEKCSPEVFLKSLKKIIEKLPDECEQKNDISKRIDNNDFLIKINVTDNGAIPHQLHKRELLKILENQAKYYPSLQENKDKIIDLFSFRIPYYVGPLASSKTKSKWSWIVRKNDEQIRPWNFQDIVDEDATAEKFIRKMTNKCTYLLNEDVMPKNSLLYSKFCVLNELNNIKINDRHLAKDIKSKIIDILFKGNKKVTIKMLKKFFELEGLPSDEIMGTSNENNFNSNMASYIDLQKILGTIDENNTEQCEKLIYWITIFEEKKILKRKIKKECPNFTNDQIEALSKLKYSGWSRLSKKLLIGLKSNDGETIMDKLEKTPLNFMQIINEKEFGFDEQINKLMFQTSKTIKYDDIDEIPTSPANKRGIWQAICVVKEISKIMKKEPNNIYIEFARNEGKKELKDNKAKKILKIYENLGDEIKNYDYSVYKELKGEQDNKDFNEKRQLYYLQNGKCLYSGKPLNLDDLSLYEVDHVIPRSYKKDDSIDNKALVLKIENQTKKDNLLLSDNIIDGQIEWWKSLLKSGLMSQTKFYRLIKRDILETNEQREKFVQRQLVETRQITKNVTNLLKNMYSDTNIYSLRAELTHNLREKNGFYKNRNINDCHHAQDAYILSIIGNIIEQKLNFKDEFRYGEYVKKYFQNPKSKSEEFGIIMGMVSQYTDIDKIRKTMNYKDYFISTMLIEGTGQFYNQTLYSPKEKPVISLKDDRSTEKYGGYNNENDAYFVIYEYINSKNKKEYALIGIPIKISYDINMEKNTIENYIRTKDLKCKDIKIIKSKLLKNQQYLDGEGQLIKLCSASEIRADKQLIVSSEVNRLIYIMNLNKDKISDKQINELSEKYEYIFEYLLDKLHKEYNIFESIYDTLKERTDDFNNLVPEMKKSVINGLIQLMATGQGNLTAIGLSDRAGRKSGVKFNTAKLLNMTFIDKSVTGMYERRYKINGLEDCNSK